MFAKRLRALRLEKGLSRVELAELAGLGPNTVRDYEQGLREPSLRSAFALADALGVAVDDFRDGKRNKSGKAPAPSQEAPGAAGQNGTSKGQGRKRKGKGE